MSNRQKLTDAIVRSIPAPTEDKGGMVFDTIVHGFAIRVRPSGSRTWIYQYKIGNKNRRMSIGTFPAMPAVIARETAADLAAQVRLGNDPAAAKEAKRREADQTFKKIVAEQYLISLGGRVAQGTMAQGTFNGIKQYLNVLAKPVHGHTAGYHPPRHCRRFEHNRRQQR